MVVTVMKRDYKNFVEEAFRIELRDRLQKEVIINCSKFEQIFLQALNKHAPPKKKVLIANDKPYMTKIVRTAIMRRSGLENKYYRDKLPETGRAYKKQKNYTKRLIKKEKRKYFSNLNINNYTDNKKFLDHCEVFIFINYDGGSKKITLVNDDNIISNDEEVAETFNTFFIDSVESLDITENKVLLNDAGDLKDPVKIALKKFESHLSIIDINEKVTVENKFSFSKVSISVWYWR